MHQRILMRAKKDPFDVRGPEEAYEGNWIGENNGNLVFSHAAHKLLRTPTARITSTEFKVDLRDADRINEQYDVYVIPLANAFRPSYAHLHRADRQLVERLRIPVVVFGVGVQTDIGYRRAPAADRPTCARSCGRRWSGGRASVCGGRSRVST